jgi:hypothetical protein
LTPCALAILLNASLIAARFHSIELSSATSACRISLASGVRNSCRSSADGSTDVKK